MSASPEEALRKLVALRIRRLREDKALRQVDLEAETGIAQPTLSQIQSGKRNPSLASLAKIAAALGVHPAVLLLDPRKKKDRAALESLGGE